MELRYSVTLDVDRHGNPSCGYITRQEAGGQLQWIADTEFGPFDTWLEALGWLRRQVSVDMDSRFT